MPLRFWEGHIGNTSCHAGYESGLTYAITQHDLAHGYAMMKTQGTPPGNDVISSDLNRWTDLV